MVMVTIKIWLLLLSLSCISAQKDHMKWNNISDPKALCNDFTQAGYFIRENRQSQKWFIYLESGGFCVSGHTCNRRFTNSNFRAGDLLSDFNVRETWTSNCGAAEANNTFSIAPDSDCSRKRVISPLMTSLWRYAPEKEDFTIEGRDFLSTDPMSNSQFYDFNHVLVPYCSSDLWLGNDDENAEGDEFRFDPDATSSIQFTFRGARIVRSAITDLIERNHGLINATEIVFAGSSAGGIGVINHMKWIRENITNLATSPSNIPRMSAILDSSWFVDFRESISKLLTDEAQRSNRDSVNVTIDIEANELFKSIKQHETCQVTSATSNIPCCLLAECVLSNSTLYPVDDTPTLLVLSLYDVYVLAISLRDEIILNSSSDDESSCPLQLCSEWEGATGSSSLSTGGFSVSYLQRVSEYGGVMNASVTNIAMKNPQFSYYITSCFQHIYFTPSNLIGDDSSALLGSNKELFGNGQFSEYINHTQEPGRWSDYSIPVWKSSLWGHRDRLSIREAIRYWRNSTGKPLHIRQTCVEPHCDVNVCPDKIAYEVSDDHIWEDDFKILVSCLVLAIAALSLCIFAVLKIHNFVVCQLQRRHVMNHSYMKLSPEAGPYSFPSIMVGGYSIACRNLTFSVKYQRKKHKISDESQLLVLSDIDINDPKTWSSYGNTIFENRIKNGTLDTMEREQEHRTAPDGGINEFKSVHNSLKSERNGKGDAFEYDEAMMDFPENMSTFGRSQGTVSSRGTTRMHPGLRRTTTQMSISLARNYMSRQVDEFRNTDPVSKVESSLSSKKQVILKDVSLYFNPGELVAIMGPSGCGKTTLLDILTGRRRDGKVQGDVLINGFPLDLVRSDFVNNTGYLMQLTSPYYEELTVRENLTLAAQLRLPSNMKYSDKFDRVEKVIKEVCLDEKADIVVGGSYGPGLSGGQKRKLAIAIQLLKEPQVLVLDEPTSGLDSNASFDMLTMLNQLTKSRRTIIMTIHQPRLEIFHMFHRIVFLCEGQVAYFGKPALAYEVCTMALKKKLAAKNQVWPGLEDHNPADIIVDMLGNKKFRNILIDHYNESREPKWVKRAIRQAKENADTTIYNKETIDGSIMQMRKKASTLDRLSAFEARAGKRATIPQLLYLPAFFTLYGLLLGSVYYKTANPFLIVSGFCVYSVASALFMFPVMHLYYDKALKLYHIEHMDGVGRSFDLVIQGFTRFVTLAFIPVILCAAILYLLSVQTYSLVTFLELALVNVALNQTWVALLAFVITAFPDYAIRISPILASVFGFASGFFIPVRQMPPWWCWLFYINPNFYGFSSSAFILLSSFDSESSCGSELECYLSSGKYIIEQFSFGEINPYLNIVILLSMTVVFLIAATVAMTIRHTDFRTKYSQLSVTLSTKIKQMKGAPRSLKRSLSTFSSRHVNRGSNEMLPTDGRPSREPRPSLLEDFSNMEKAQLSDQDSSLDSEVATDDCLTTNDELETSDGGVDEYDDDVQIPELFGYDQAQVMGGRYTQFSSVSEEEGDGPMSRDVHQTREGRGQESVIRLAGSPVDEIEETDHVVPGIAPELEHRPASTSEEPSHGDRIAPSVDHLSATEPRKGRSSSFIRDQMEMADEVPELPSVLSRQGGVSSRLSSSTSAVHSPISPSPVPFQLPVRKASSSSKVAVKHTRSANAFHQNNVGDFPPQHRQGSRRSQVRRSQHNSVYLDGERHNVWTPSKQRSIQPEEQEPSHPPATPDNLPLRSIAQSQSVSDVNNATVIENSPVPPETPSTVNLFESRKLLESRIQAAKEVGREITNQIAHGNHKWERNYSRMVTRRQKKRRNRENAFTGFWPGDHQREDTDGDRDAKGRHSHHSEDHADQRRHLQHSPVKGVRPGIPLRKSPSVPAWDDQDRPHSKPPTHEPEEMSFDTMRKRQQGDGWRKGMKKVLVQSKARPLPIHVYRKLLMETTGPVGTQANQQPNADSQRNSRPMSASLEESGGCPEHSLKQRNEFNRMSMPASKQKHKNAPSTGGNRRADIEEVKDKTAVGLSVRSQEPGCDSHLHGDFNGDHHDDVFLPTHSSLQRDHSSDVN